jgi:TonB family protein
VTATFEIDAQGRLSHVKLVKSSDIATANDAARSAIYAAAPFDPLPDTLKPVAQIEFTFDYNVFKNRQPASR